MRFNFKTISMFMAGAALFMTSCSQDDSLNGGGVTPPEGTGIGYMAFSISTDLTRAADSEFAGDQNGTPAFPEVGDEIFSDGQPNEYAICPNTQANLAIFFTGNQVFGASYLTPFEKGNDKGHPSHDGYPEQFYTYVTRWINTDNKKPDKVLVLLNVDPDKLKEIETQAKQWAQDETSDALHQIYVKTAATEKFGVYTFSGEDYFTMTNSSYVVDSDLALGAAIDGKVYETPEQALENRVVVYVERTLSKFELTFNVDGKNTPLTSQDLKGILITPSNKENTSIAKINYVKEYTGKEDNLDFPDYTPVDWDIYIGNWGINGVERENYYFKHVNPEAEYFGKEVAWNVPGLHRSYWAESQNYLVGVNPLYPTQYRPTLNEAGGNDREKPNWGIDNYETMSDGKTSKDQTVLTYYSFNQFKKRGTYKYAPERTYGSAAGLVGYGPYRYASNYLVCAQLVLKKDAEGHDIDDPETTEGLYLKNVGDKWAAYNFYFADEASYIRYAYHRMVSQFADGRQHVLVNGANGNKTYQTNSDKAQLYIDDALENPLKVADAAKYFATVPAMEIHGDGKRMLALREGAELWYKNQNGDPVKLTADDINVIAFNLAESAKHFTNGMMYYSIPVQHNFGLSKGSTTTVEKKGEYKLGQFGTVRNHWYVLNINTIGNVGTPVDNPNQPIIPDPEDIYNIALEIVVLPWHKIDNGSVDL